jgi:3-hydroxybutyryl-CoA dehydrogenase
LKVEDIKHITVVGAGNMGSQIAQHLSQVGKYRVSMVDTTDEIINRGFEAIRARLQRHFVDKNKMTPDEMTEIIERITRTTNIADAVKDADFVIESVFEDLKVKQDVFRQLDASAPPDTILASNSSMLNNTSIGNVTERADKVIGMHFFNPVGVMRLIEVVRGASTSDETIAVTCALAQKLGKETVVCNDYSYGFLANRIYSAMVKEAVEVVWERVSSPEDADKALKLGFNLPMGPLELEDMTGGWGLKVLSEEARIKEMGEKGRLNPLIRIMVRAGYTGGPGKKGIYAFWKEVMTR